MIHRVTSEKREKILNSGVHTLVKLIRGGYLTSTDITQTYIKQIQNSQAFLNAVVEKRFFEALKEAAVYDRLARKGQFIGPLHGIPISIKESINVQGMKTTGSLIQRQDIIAKTDAPIVTTLKQAGAIIIAKTNTPSLCLCQETDNKLYGRTNNPWNIYKTPGGSSGGEGALLGIGGAAAGIGSDIGGSIRFPSHFNGVIGFKPSQDQVSQKGHFPQTPEFLQKRMMSMGPMSKSVEDAKILYELIIGQSLPHRNWSDYKINFLPHNLGLPLSNQTQEVYDQARKFIYSFNQKLNESIPPYFNESAPLWQEIMSIDGGKSVQREAFSTDRPNIVKEYIEEQVIKTSQYHSYLTWALIGISLFKPSKKRIQEIKQTIKEGDLIISNYLKHRLLIFPVYHQGALEHGDVYHELFSIRKTFKKYLPYVAYANVWGLPVLTIPAGEDENGMPIGLQIISAHGNETAIFQLGALLEANLRGYKRCPYYD